MNFTAVKNNKVLYIHRKLVNNEIFYIGIGNSKRPYRTHGRNNHWNHIVKKYGYIINVLVKNLSKDDAVELEMFVIELIGVSNISNMTIGGEGLSGMVFSKESRIKMSKSHKGKTNSKEIRKRMSDSHKGIVFTDKHIKNIRKANKLKVISKEHRIKINKSKQVPIVQYTTNDKFIKIWDSAKIAGESLSINKSNITNCCRKSRKTAGNYIWRYK